MTLNVYVGGVFSGTDLGNQRVRLGSLEGFTEAADAGQVSFSAVELDDPDGDLTVQGLKGVIVEETACPTGYKRIGTYYVDTRTINRGRPSHRLDNDRLQTVQLVDVNAVAGFRVLKGNEVKRPAESDVSRVAWLLTTEEFGSYVSDLGFVSTETPRQLDAADYRGQYPRDVLNDCIAPAFGKNWFIYYDETADGLGLFYDDRAATTYESTIAISNVLSDITFDSDFAVSSNTFPPYQEVELERDPSQVYDGVLFQYDTGSMIYRQREATHDVFGLHRDAVVNFPRIGKLSTAESFAEQFLTRSSEEIDTIRVSVELPRSKVNLVRAGMRMRVRFSHLPGYETDTYMRVTRRTVRQQRETDQSYLVDLELTSKGPIGTGGGGGITPPEPWVPCPPPVVPEEDALTVRRYVTVFGSTEDHEFSWDDGVDLNGDPVTGDPAEGSTIVCVGIWRDPGNADLYMPGIGPIVVGVKSQGDSGSVGNDVAIGTRTVHANDTPTQVWDVDTSTLLPWSHPLESQGSVMIELSGPATVTASTTSGPTQHGGHLSAGSLTVPSGGLMLGGARIGSADFSGASTIVAASDVTELLSDGPGPDAWVALRTTSGEIGAGATFADFLRDWHGGCSAVFVGTTDDDEEETPTEDCPPPIPGQQVAPVALDVDCETTVYTTPYPYVAGSLEVWIRNSAGELIKTTVDETSPEDGTFTTPFPPCCDVIAETLILTAQEEPDGPWLVLTDGEGTVLTARVAGDSTGSCLVVSFIAASSESTGVPAVPPTPTVPPDAPPPPSESGTWFGIADPWVDDAFGSLSEAPSTAPFNNSGNTTANALGGIWYTGDLGGATIGNYKFTDRPAQENILVFDGASNFTIDLVDFDSTMEGIYLVNCSDFTISRLRARNIFGPFTRDGTHRGNLIQMDTCSNYTIEDLKVLQPHTAPAADWGTEDIISIGGGTSHGNGTIRRFKFDGGAWQSWSGTGFFIGDSDPDPAHDITVEDGVLLNPGQTGIGTGHLGGPVTIRRIDIWQDPKSFTSTIDPTKTVAPNNPLQLRGTTYMSDIRSRFAAGGSTSTLATYSNSGTLTPTGSLDFAWTGPKPVVTL